MGYEMLSFRTLHIWKSEAITEMLHSNNKIDLNIKPKEQEMLELTIIHRSRAIELEKIEKELLSTQKAALWEEKTLKR